MVFCGSTLPSERGGHKDVCKDERGNDSGTNHSKMKETQEGLFLSEEEIRKMLRHLEQMEEYAACGKAYREEVSRNVVKLFAVWCSLKFLLR